MNRKLVKYLVSILLVVLLSITLYSCSKTSTKPGKSVTLTYKIYGSDICVTLPDEEAEKVMPSWIISLTILFSAAVFLPADLIKMFL